MKNFSAAMFLAITFVLTGCATSQHVTLATRNPPKIPTSASLVTQEGNSADMDIGLSQQLQAIGVAMKPPVAAGTTNAADRDILLAYTDVWRWDVVMYLKNLNVNIFDAKSGNLIVTGTWENSVFHGFQNYREVIRGLITEMMATVQTARDAPLKTAGVTQ